MLAAQATNLVFGLEPFDEFDNVGMVETLHGLDLAHDHLFVTLEQVLAHDLDGNIPRAAWLVASGSANHAKSALAECLVERIILFFGCVSECGVRTIRWWLTMQQVRRRHGVSARRKKVRCTWFRPKKPHSSYDCRLT